ncbi:DUF3014 domain-containing protein [Stenotrophomonas sp. 24(2023)]|uniref:DUF3014 domain-containing protein n=1 Tax=Stenotrophomonas sp. 24(2023) TaxID=3068324 RepID=UPI0027E18139|nr:DUF3014 domain-containing protein [Stenotrophomonas sp. 24(2023)]WMJ70270.1 DUF3014 domain-containing protein [Stenotrophomonas sp. 24(2023)]
MQSGKAVWPWIVGVVVIGGAGAWLFRDQFAPGGAAPATVEAPLPATAGPPAAAPPSPAAAIQHPLDTEAAADPALPALADSDATAWNALASLFPGEGVLAPVMREFLIQRLVTHIDNLDKPSVPPTALALRPLPGELQVDAGADGTPQLAPANAARYAPYVKAFTAADADALGTAYLRFYPLVQKAYASLGRPDAYFNDRLVQVIDHLLATPEPARPLAVERDERGRYRFADPALQSRSVGQKALLRLDLQQERAVKQQLRALRAVVTRG